MRNKSSRAHDITSVNTEVRPAGHILTSLQLEEIPPISNNLNRFHPIVRNLLRQHISKRL